VPPKTAVSIPLERVFRSPPNFDFPPNILLTNKDNEHKEAPKKIEDISDGEKIVKEGLGKVRAILDYNSMHGFHTPKDAEDKEELGVENQLF